MRDPISPTAPEALAPSPSRPLDREYPTMDLHAPEFPPIFIARPGVGIGDQTEKSSHESEEGIVAQKLEQTVTNGLNTSSLVARRCVVSADEGSRCRFQRRGSWTWGISRRRPRAPSMSIGCSQDWIFDRGV